MTAVLTGPDISAGHPLPKLDGQAFLGFRETLGTSFVDPEFRTRFGEFIATGSDAVSLGYSFLTGPKRGQPIANQVAYWAKAHRCELGALDWERDTYTLRGVTYDMGMQPFGVVRQGLVEAKKLGIWAGLYTFVGAMNSDILDQLVPKKGEVTVPFLWMAAFDGVSVPDYIVKRCQERDTFLIHQYTGTGLDRSRVIVGTLDQLHALAGRPPASGEPMTNLFPLTVHRVVDLPKGAVLQKTPDGPIYTTLGKAATLGLLGATGTHFQVADGDYGVYVARVGLVPRTEDKNVGV